MSNPLSSTSVDATLKASTAAIGIVGQGTAGSSAAPWFYAVTNPTTAVTVSNPTTSVTVSSGVILGAGSSSNTIGAVAITNPATAVTVSSGAILGAGSSANILGAVATTPNSTTRDVNILAGTNAIGSVAQGSGSSASAPWYVDGWGFSSGVVSITTFNSSADTSLLAASTARKACVIVNDSTGTVLYVGFSTAAVTTSAYAFQVPASGLISMGGQIGSLPNFNGNMRVRVGTTTLAGPGRVIEYRSS